MPVIDLSFFCIVNFLSFFSKFKKKHNLFWWCFCAEIGNWGLTWQWHWLEIDREFIIWLGLNFSPSVAIFWRSKFKASSCLPLLQLFALEYKKTPSYVFISSICSLSPRKCVRKGNIYSYLGDLGETMLKHRKEWGKSRVKVSNFVF